MIVAPLAGLVLIVAIGTGPTIEPERSPLRMSAHQKNAAIQPLLRTATECIASSVAEDPRFKKSVKSGDIGDLIVDAMPKCVGQVRALIGAHDRYFGEGSGEEFFIGPYLDALPTAVAKWVKDALH
jgi:hypothetical protein